jgi:CheY-like chemotaxis protein
LLDEYGDHLLRSVRDRGVRRLVIDGLSALQSAAVEPGRVELVFLDYMMPVMDGAAMLRGVMDRPDLRDIPVVMMSSMPEATVAERCIGYRAFMRKPFTLTEMVEVAARMLDGKAPRPD